MSDTMKSVSTQAEAELVRADSEETPIGETTDLSLHSSSVIENFQITFVKDKSTSTGILLIKVPSFSDTDEVAVDVGVPANLEKSTADETVRVNTNNPKSTWRHLFERIGLKSRRTENSTSSPVTTEETSILSVISETELSSMHDETVKTKNNSKIGSIWRNVRKWIFPSVNTNSNNPTPAYGCSDLSIDESISPILTPTNSSISSVFVPFDEVALEIPTADANLSNTDDNAQEVTDKSRGKISSILDRFKKQTSNRWSFKFSYRISTEKNVKYLTLIAHFHQFKACGEPLTVK
uniref:Uncharacterized protein n=1 Tax=Caenorhabditis japonica TaxID=281687 RepID=A0A8R1E1M2_CAEJA